MTEDAASPSPAPELTPAQRKELRALAHHLDPVVMVGDAGLTPAVIAEANRALKAHELIKVRVAGDDREARMGVMERLCAALGCAPVQAIGKLLVVWRPRPEAAASRSAPHVNKKVAAAQAAAKAARKVPLVSKAPARKAAGAKAAAGGKAQAAAKPAAKRAGSPGAKAPGGRASGGAKTEARPSAARPWGGGKAPAAKAGGKAPAKKAGGFGAKAPAGRLKPAAGGPGESGPHSKAPASRARTPARHGQASGATQGPGHLQGRTWSRTAGPRSRGRKG